MERRALGVVLALMAASAAGCCPKPPLLDLSKLPPALSLEEQVARLEAHTKLLPRIKAKTRVQGVELRYRDKDKTEKTLNAEGTLLLRQGTGEDSQSPADVMLVGMLFDQQIFQAGRNATDWWFILWPKPETAWTGDSRRAVDWERLGERNETGGLSTSILRADLVQDLLGLGSLQVQQLMWNRGQDQEREAMVLRVDDYVAENVVLVENIPPTAGRIWIKREIFVNRFTDEVKEVRLYGPQGTMVMRSKLDKYLPVTYSGDNNDAVKTPPPKFPYHVELEYPGQGMRVTLDFESVVVPAKMNDASFETPDFKDFTDHGGRVLREP